MNGLTLPSYWTEEEDQILINGKRKGATYKEIAAELEDRTWKSIRARWIRIEEEVYSPIEESIYPRYDDPLVMEEDAVVLLPDIESPFHHAGAGKHCFLARFARGLFRDEEPFGLRPLWQFSQSQCLHGSS